MLEYYDLKQAQLMVGGVPVAELAHRFGTPFYAYDLGVVQRKYQMVKSAFPDFDVFFSVKANGSLAVSSWLRYLGAGAEVASDGELFMVLRAGFAPQDIMFAGPAKTDAELEYAIRTGIYAINAESAPELERIERISRRLGVRTRVQLRVNSVAGVDGAPERMVGGPSQFGFDEKTLVSDIRAISPANTDISGFHLYTASDVLDENQLFENFQRTLDISARLGGQLRIPISGLDFGGGFGVPHSPEDSELDIASLGRRVTARLAEPSCPVKASEVRLMWELGRYLVSEAGVYVTRVVEVKESRGKTYVLTDGGMNQFIRPVFMGRNHPTLLVNRLGEDATTLVDVAGPTCTPIDIVATDVTLPAPRTGDLVGFFNAGAYGFTMSMLYFLGHPLPAEVAVLEGHPALARSRGEVGDCLVGQVDVENYLWANGGSEVSRRIGAATSPGRTSGLGEHLRTV